MPPPLLRVPIPSTSLSWGGVHRSAASPGFEEYTQYACGCISESSSVKIKGWMAITTRSSARQPGEGPPAFASSNLFDPNVDLSEYGKRGAVHKALEVPLTEHFLDTNHTHGGGGVDLEEACGGLHG